MVRVQGGLVVEATVVFFFGFLSFSQIIAHFAHASVRTFYLGHWMGPLKDRKISLKIKLKISMPDTGSRLRSVSTRVCRRPIQDSTRERSWGTTIRECRAPA